MSLLQYDFANTPDIKPVPAGEYYVRLVSLDPEAQSKSGLPMCKYQLEIEGEQFASDVFGNIMLPTNMDSPKEAAMKIKRLEKMLTAFGADISQGVDSEVLIGNRALVRLRYVLAGEFPEKNEVEAWIRPA